MLEQLLGDLVLVMDFKKLSFFFFFITQTIQLSAQSAWASSVYDFHFGISQTFGQDSAYFPQNVLGALGSNINPTMPASTPEEVCSIGKGGFIVLEFDPPILDGIGVDFTVFENAFFYNNNSQVFDEWMMVSVSNDGQTWKTFPYDTLTGDGFAGRTPTAATGANYQDPNQSGGDSFDLQELGLTEAKYVKLTDATQYQSSDRLSADLDAVIAIHTTISNEKLYADSQIQINQNDSQIKISSGLVFKDVTIYELSGKKIYSNQQVNKNHHSIYLPKNNRLFVINCIFANGSQASTKIIH